MKTLRIITLLIFSLGLVLNVSSQDQVQDTKGKSLPFFTSSGNIAIHTEQMDALADTIAVINHREDDIVWSRIVYRVVDLREKQNNQLYYPIIPNNKYKNLLRLILEAHALHGLDAYNKKEGDIQPDYSKLLKADTIPTLFYHSEWNANTSSLRDKEPFVTRNLMNSFDISNTNSYEKFAKDQYKFLLQEVVFFNKHYSRMYTKIIGIAPMNFYNDYNVSQVNTSSAFRNKEEETVWDALKFSVLCWYFYDDLRPYLAKQYIIPNGNETQRLTFDDFFTQKLYQSYLLGDENMRDRLLLESYNDVESIRREQKRIETELLNFEQDLWEY